MTEASAKTVSKLDIPLLDPTINVQNLLHAEVVRLNDLAKAEKVRVDERTNADMLRVDQLREAETRRIDEQLELREHYEKELREAEAKRIDANRAGDAAAVATANERATQQAAVLASQMATMVDNTRALVDANAAASSQQLQSAVNAMNERISNLEKMGYQRTGQEKYTDPAMNELVKQVTSLTSGAATGTGRGLGANATILYFVMALSAVATVLSILTYIAK